MKDIYNLKIKEHDTLDDARDKNDRLINMVKKIERQVRSLKTRNITLQRAFDKSEIFLKDSVKNVSLQEIFVHLKEGRPLRKLSRQCPNCGDKDLKKLLFRGFYVVLCSNCDYREKIEDDGLTEKT